MYEFMEPVKKDNTMVKIILGAVAGALIAMLLLPFFFGMSPSEFYKRPGSVVATKEQATPGMSIEEARRDNPVVAVARKVQPSVVLISTQSKLNDAFHQNLLVPSDGSGVIYDKNGYILTNNHVISDAKKIVVRFADGREAAGKVIGRDADSDLAVVKVTRKSLPTADFGSADSLVVGDVAVAIGSPFGYEGTVTSGVISALHRNISVPDPKTNENVLFTDLIQTDASINPGNSGGALCNQFGQVVGINTLIVTGVENSGAGIGFAIPIDLAIQVANQLIKGGKVSHPYIGVIVETLNEQKAVSFGVAQTRGVVVVDVQAGLPAQKAGLKKGDIIISINGDKVMSSEELIADIRKNKVGDKVVIKYIRMDKEISVAVPLVEKP